MPPPTAYCVCQKEATFNLKDEKSRIVPYFSQLILQTSGKGLVSPMTTARHAPETGRGETDRRLEARPK